MPSFKPSENQTQKTLFKNFKLKTLLERKMVYFQIGRTMRHCCCLVAIVYTKKQRLRNEDLALTIDQITKTQETQAGNANCIKLRIRKVVLALV